MALLLSKCLAMSKILELTCAVSQHVSIVNIVLKLNKRLQYAIIIIFYYGTVICPFECSEV